MSVELRKQASEKQKHADEGQIVPFTPLRNLEHLLKVTGSISRDANKAWSDVWRELKPHVTTSGMVGPSLKQGFIPSCGWPEFLERLWLLKHYIDSIQRISENQR